MKMKWILALAVLIFAAGSVDAQSKNKRGKRADRMIQQLDLSEDQVAQYKEINADYKAQVKEIYGNEELSGPEKEQQIAALRDNREMAVQGMLNDDQLASYTEMKTKRETKRAEKAERKKAKVVSKMGLSETQQAQWEELNNKYRLEKKSVMASDLTKEEKKAQAEALQAQKESELAQILDEEQFQQYLADKEKVKNKRKQKRKKRQANR